VEGWVAMFYAILAILTQLKCCGLAMFIQILDSCLFTGCQLTSLRHQNYPPVLLGECLLNYCAFVWQSPTLSGITWYNLNSAEVGLIVSPLSLFSVKTFCQRLLSVALIIYKCEVLSFWLFAAVVFSREAAHFMGLS